MCGIVGFISKSLDKHKSVEILNKIKKTINHRGPDDDGIWFDEKINLYLGHQRLSILDLSISGSQPMHSASGRYVIIYNGEIYNHLKLRKDIEEKTSININWNSTSDTETLLNYIEAFGLEFCLNEIRGMFAFALWDKKNKKLILCRDSIGEKPLYFGWIKDTFIFASELKPFQLFPGFDNEISKKSLSQYFRYSYVPNPFSIYDRIYKLQPGCFLEFKNTNFHEPSKISFAPYSNSNFIIKKWWILKKENNIDFNNSNDVKSILEKKLEKSVKSQMISDVNLGAFLSGGIDSSLIVSLMQKNSAKKIDTFTIGFNEASFNEARYAKKIANHLNTNHHEMTVSSGDIFKTLPSISQIYDEPFSDSSQIPTFILSKFAKKNVTVCLSGDGGDELFGGYNRYIWSKKIWRYIRFIPLPIRNIISFIIYATPQNLVNYTEKKLNQNFSSKVSIKNLSEKLFKLRNKILKPKTFNEFYIELVSEWSNVKELLLLDKDFSINNITKNLIFDSKDLTQKMMFYDVNTYLTDDILCKVDRASMFNSLETRAPFLNRDVVDLAFNIPLNYKINNNKAKWILREILNDYVPKNLIERPKMGFSIPLASWLRGPLKEWCLDTLSKSNLNNFGFNSKLIKNTIDEHMKGTNNHHNKIWSLMIFIIWYQNQTSKKII